MAIISAVYAIQSYVTFEVNSEQLIESTVLKNQVIASSLIQNLDLFIDKRISDFQSLEKAKELKQLSNQANSYLRLCEIALSKEYKVESIEFKKYAKMALGIAQELKSLPLLWKSYYWMFKVTGDKSHLKKTNEYLKEQFKHIPAKYLKAFKQYVRKYTGEELSE